MPYIARFQDGREEQIAIKGSAMKPYGLDYYIGLAEDSRGIKRCLFFPPCSAIRLIDFGAIVTIYKEGLNGRDV